MNYYEYLQSPAWKTISNAAKERCGWRCAVCGHDWKKNDWGPLQAHHPDYKKLFKERPEDLVCLCKAHHPKGAFSREKIAMWRSSYRWRKRVARLFRGLWWLTKLLARSILRLVRARART